MTQDDRAEIGLIGLGTMGANLALNIAEHGFRVAVYNRTVETTRRFVADAGELSTNLIACDSLEALLPPSGRRARLFSWCRPARWWTITSTCCGR